MHTIVIIVLLALVGYHRTWSFRVWQPLGGGGREGGVEGVCVCGGGGNRCLPLLLLCRLAASGHHHLMRTSTDVP